MSRQFTIEEVYKIIDQVEDESIRNLLRIAYGQLRAEYEFDRGWKQANLPDLIRLDKRVKELEAALWPFATIVVISNQDDGFIEIATDMIEPEYIYAARKILGEKE